MHALRTCSATKRPHGRTCGLRVRGRSRRCRGCCTRRSLVGCPRSLFLLYEREGQRRNWTCSGYLDLYIRGVNKQKQVADVFQFFPAVPSIRAREETKGERGQPQLLAFLSTRRTQTKNRNPPQNVSQFLLLSTPRTDCHARGKQQAGSSPTERRGVSLVSPRSTI